MAAIILTDAQQNAKEKMENGLKRTPRWNFQTYEDFNKYMEFLIKAIKRNIKTNEAVKEWKISYAEINERKRKKIEKYYNSFDNLRKYASKYIDKYYPSEKKLLNKLLEKSKNQDVAEAVVEYSLEKEIQMPDEKLAQNYFDNYVAMWKNYSKIKNLLVRKLFPTKLIDNIIDESKENTFGSLLDPFTLTRKIETLLKQWKSEFYIKSKLADTEYDRELIDEILNELNFDNSDVMQKEIDKMIKKKLTKQKIVQRMFWKWFRYDDFKYYLEDYE